MSTPGSPIEPAGGAVSPSGPGADGNARVGPKEVELARADAIAVTVGPGARVLVVGAPMPGLGDALATRGCVLTVLTPPGRLIVEPWTSQTGTIDEVRPDLGSFGSFDAIVAPHLLDLAADPAASLRRIAGALGTMGRIVLTATRPAPPGALHRHDAAEVERLCELAGLAVRATTAVNECRPVELVDGMAVVGNGTLMGTTSPEATAGASTTVVVAHPVTSPPALPALPEEASTQAGVTVAVDRRLRAQQARIRALEDEVRALRAAVDRPPSVVAGLARAVRTRMRPRA